MNQGSAGQNLNVGFGAPGYSGPPRRANRGCLVACGCLVALLVGLVVVVLVGVVFLRSQFTSLVAPVFGFEGGTPLAQVLAAAPTPAPLPTLAAPATPQTAGIGPGAGNLSNIDQGAIAGVSVLIDRASERDAARVTIDEAGLLALCAQQSRECRGEDPRLQNVRFDLRPNRIIVYVDVNLDIPVVGAQTIGVLFDLDSSARSFLFGGVELAGNVYTDFPPNFGNFDEEIDRIEQNLDDVIATFVLEADGAVLPIDRIHIDDALLTILFGAR